MRRAVWATISFGLALAARSQEPSHPPPAIQDNSFLVEEAYNQEAGVVQHINEFTRDSRTGEWVATFTQEYPVGGLRNQLSYTILYHRVNDPAGTAIGLGDLAFNYRYQLVGNGEA
ncbi:MAG TPA: transporter, partial [Thermoanaerobaculia bacterium]|nr:transporter [Thermoanaerobaculia bacterium]